MTDKAIRNWTWTGRILILLGMLAGVLAVAEKLPAAIQDYAALAVALLGVASRWCEQQLPPPKVKAPAGPAVLFVVALAMIAAAATSACNPYAAAWKTTAGVMEASKTAGKGLATAGQAGYDKCAQHGLKTKEFGTCSQDWIRYLTNWQGYARPGFRTAVAASYGTIRVAEEAGKKDVDIMAVMKPGACAAYRGLREWGHKLPDKGKAILAALGFVDAVACAKPKTADGVSAALVLSVGKLALDVVKWIVDILGTPNDELRKRIDTWLRAPPDDDTEPLLLKFKAGLP